MPAARSRLMVRLYCGGLATGSSRLAREFESLASAERFYSAVDVVTAEAGFAVRLDGRAPRSPRRAPLILPTRALAELIAAEWAAQGVSVVIATMPATRLAWTALDGVAAARDETAAEVASCAAADQL